MATKKKSGFSNSDFLSTLNEDTRSSMEETGTQGEQGEETKNSDTSGKIELFDIYNMVSAPEEWNIYPLLKDDPKQKNEYLELKLSIYNSGVLQPIYLWEQKDGKLMVLAGHNRVAMCKEIIEENKESPGFSLDKYRFIPGIKKSYEELEEQEAKDLIDDTNCGRDLSKMPIKYQIQLTKRRMDYYKRKFYAKGQRIDQVANELGMQKTALYENLAISDKVIPEFQELYFSMKLTKKAVSKFAFFNKEIQNWMKDNFFEEIVEEKINKIKKNMTKEDIEVLFQTTTIGVKKITIEVPTDKVDEFRKLVNDFLGKKVKKPIE